MTTAPVISPGSVRGAPETSGEVRTPRGRRVALVVAVVAALAAVVQQVLLAVGIGGGQPWPWLLVAVPAWLLARRGLRVVPAPPPVVARAVDRLGRIPAWAGAAGVLAMAAAVWAALQDDEPLIGHEEAVYANKARSWLDGTPDAGWGTYRPVGLPVLGRIALAVHDDVGALRVVALLLTLFTLITTYLVAARLATPRRAVVATLLLLGGLGFLRRVPQFLNDIGATGLLLIVVYLLVRAQEKPGSRALYALPFAALAAFYLRYGVVGTLAAVVAAAVLAYGPRAWLAQSRRLALGVGVFLAGLVPHFVYATEVTGSPLGLILSATEHAGRSYVGDGLVYYVSIFPYRLAGDLGAVVMAAGLWGLGAAIRRRRQQHHDRRSVFLGMSAILTFVVLGVATDGEPRFVYLSVVLLTVLGVQTLAEAAGRWSATVLAAVAALAAVTVPATAQYVAHDAMPGPNAQHLSTVAVARQLASDRPCLLVTGYEPDLGWYSGCDAVTFGQYRRMAPPSGAEVSLILFERGRSQPGPASLRRLIGGRATTTRTIPTEGSLGTATVITLRAERPGPPRTTAPAGRSASRPPGTRSAAAW
ncbi:glycosyltransferase family 39 protein [Streptomyces sp. ME19-01-6]|uniref:glycosyltransferase family 39 protein n=1 Tax=Streptomyces sp. ME19-01-6 TaxID=3028686 RepID=UPI0029A503BA|nr:glycosyltransferase family 39 protein [Streptomyces sp. ME19-01-6]MDX3228828.1 glycosyltransferase family 39 protein [Streptomyces sp. ME19-01-6]